MEFNQKGQTSKKDLNQLRKETILKTQRLQQLIHLDASMRPFTEKKLLNEALELAQRIEDQKVKLSELDESIKNEKELQNTKRILDPKEIEDKNEKIRYLEDQLQSLLAEKTSYIRKSRNNFDIFQEYL